MKLKLSISPKLFFICFIPLMFVGLFTCIAFSKITNDIIRDNIKTQIISSLDMAESGVMGMFDPQIANLNAVAQVAKTTQTKEYIDSVQKCVVALNESVLAYYYVTTDSLSDSKGYLLMSDDWKAPPSFSQYERPWYKNAIAANGDIVYDQYLNGRTNKQCIAVSRSVTAPNGKTIGVCGFDIGLESLSEICSKIKISENTHINIISNDGTYLGSVDSSAILNKQRNFYDDIGWENNGGKCSDYFDKGAQSTIIGGSFFGGIRIGNTPWYIVINGEVNDFTKNFKRDEFIVVVLVIILCIGVTIFFLYSMEKNRSKEKTLGTKLYGETQSLVVAAKENAATSQDQSAAVKEIVATMEDTNDLSENISTKIKDVTNVANKTLTDVNDGVVTLSKNVEKLHEIYEANQNTISGIKALGEKIENIWDIVTLINSVADQAKIIAFNAELEASSAGEAGKNFHIVATEIRRLADGIIDGTKEIKERITEIQQSSDSLILASESGTEKINEGCDNARELEEKFTSIKTSSEVTATSADDITSIIQQQVFASEQILVTLKQIAAGVENFSQATENISTAAQNVQVIAEELSEQSSSKHEALANTDSENA